MWNAHGPADQHGSAAETATLTRLREYELQTSDATGAAGVQFGPNVHAAMALLKKQVRGGLVGIQHRLDARTGGFRGVKVQHVTIDGKSKRHLSATCTLSHKMSAMCASLVTLTMLVRPLSTHGADPPVHNMHALGKPLFVSGQDGYHTYRIPALIVAPSGDLLAFCEGRKISWKDHGDVELVMKRSSDGGRSWSNQQLVHEEGGEATITIGNPCPVVDRETGRIWLPMCRDNRDVLMTYSDDDGRSWAKPRDITPQVVREQWSWVATGPGVGIQLRCDPLAGRLIIPCDHRDQTPVSDDSRNRCFSHVIYSDDHGRTWRLGGVTEPGSYECQVVELSSGRLMLNARMQQRSKGFRGVSFSNDGGANWSPVIHDQELPDPICQGSIVALPPVQDNEQQSCQLLFSNPAVWYEPGTDKNRQRRRLTVRLSQDDGDTWPFEKVLYNGAAAYSCLAVLPDRTVACLYEAGEEHWREAIYLSRFDVAWLMAGEARSDETATTP